MIDLQVIISSLEREEQQRFVTFLEKKNKRKDTKNIQLFKLMRDEHLSSKELCVRLYKKENKSAYHGLRKRLFDALIDFMATISLEDENSYKMQVIRYILVARKLLEQQRYKIAFKLLEKAILIAKEHQLYSYLNEIYHVKVQFSTYTDEPLETLIITFKENQKRYFLEEELNIVYAKMQKMLNEMLYKSVVVDFQTALEQTLEEHHIHIDKSISFKALYQLLTIASISAFVTKDYLKIEPFVLKTYDLVKLNKQKEKQLFYHIQVLYLIANTFFRNKKFAIALSYLDQMNVEMLKNRKKYYNRFKLKYSLLVGLCYNYSNKQTEAINCLKPFINEKNNDLEALLDVRLSLLVFYFQKGELQKAFTLLSKFYHTDKWYVEKAGKEWVLKKNLVEILLHLELENIDLFESRLLSFRRQYSNYLKEIHQERVLTFLKLVEVYYQNPEQVTSKAFAITVENSFEWIEARREDIFVMSFYAWLKSKMEKQPVYKTTLELIERAQAI